MTKMMIIMRIMGITMIMMFIMIMMVMSIMIMITLIRMITHRDDSIDDGGLLDGDAQGLHVEVEERVEDGHRGRLEQENQLDPDLVIKMLIFVMTIEH